MWAFLTISLLSLAASLYKDRKTEESTQSVKNALRISYVFQIAVLLIGTYISAQSDSDAKALRIAQNEKEVLVAVLHFQLPALDNYFALVKNSSSIKNYVEYSQSFNQIPAKLEKLSWESIATSHQISERDAAKYAFAELQRISRELLMLQSQYGDRIPLPVNEWASLTIKLQFEQLPQLLRNTPEGLQYANLLGRAFGVSSGKLQSTLVQIEE